MKNVQVIDGAENCTYSLFAVPEEDFLQLFPADTDIAFPDEIVAESAKSAPGRSWHRSGRTRRQENCARHSRYALLRARLQEGSLPDAPRGRE